MKTGYGESYAYKMAMMVSLLSLGLLSQNTYAQTPSDESIAQWARITDFKMILSKAW